MTAGGTWRSKPASERAPRSAVASERLAPRQVSRQSLETATNGSDRNTHRRKIAKNHPLDREKTLNLKTTEAKVGGPLINLVPLPSHSQFLNVIESVFGVMKKAIIHHSDYQTTDKMKSAISLHLRDRNAYFSDNPRRAGK